MNVNINAKIRMRTILHAKTLKVCRGRCIDERKFRKVISMTFSIEPRKRLWKERKYECVLKQGMYEIWREREPEVIPVFDFEKELAKFKGGKSRFQFSKKHYKY